MAIRNGPLWDKVLKIAVCLGLFLAFWGVQWVIPDFYQELFRLSLHRKNWKGLLPLRNSINPSVLFTKTWTACRIPTLRKSRPT